MVSPDMIERFPELSAIALQLEPRYVPGLPSLVAATVTGDANDVVDDLIRPSFEIDYGTLGYELRDASGSAIGKDPRIGSGSGITPPQLELGPSEAYRIVFDLSGAIQTCEPGDYQLTLTYAGGHAARRCVTSAPTKLSVRAPEPHEEATIARLAPERDSFGGWWGWVFRGVMTDADRPPFRLDPTDLLRLHRLIRFARFNPQALSELDALAHTFSGPCAPEALLVRADLMRRAGALDTLAELVTYGSTTFAGLALALGEVQRGEGELVARLTVVR